MKRKRLFASIQYFLLPVFFMPIVANAHEDDFTVVTVGASNNTNTVFIDTFEEAAQSNCGNRQHFKLPLDDPLVDLFFSAALTAQASGKKLRLRYMEDECIHSGILPQVFQVVE